MKIISLEFLESHKLFDRGTKLHFGDDQDDSFPCTIFTGKNGSGKTTAMSIIAQIFHNIERYHYKLKFSVKLFYQIGVSGENKCVSIVVKDGRITMSVEGIFSDRKLIDYYIIKRMTNKRIISIENEPGNISFNIVRKYLPSSVVVSGFSMHGEWPNLRPDNYLGERLVKTYDISTVYGQNHYQMPSLTRGIGRFIEIFYNRNKHLLKLLELLDFKFEGKIKINHRSTQNREWKKINSKSYKGFISKSINNEIYLNDLEFSRFGVPVTLENMSSGEKMLFIRILSILSDIEDESIVFIEEPELHLDQIWNRQLISILEILFSQYQTHFVIATHNPSLINTVSKDKIIFLHNGKVQKLEFNTLLIDPEVLFQKMYSESNIFNIAEQEILDKISQFENKESLRKFISTLGDSVFSLIANNKLRNLN